MTPDTNMQPMIEDATGELSPVKRALLEIRRLRAEAEALRQAHSAPIAIVGMSLRMPGSIASPEALWQALFEGRDLIGEVPKDRWEASLYRSPNQPSSMRAASGGFLSDIDHFDAEFFRVSPREAASMDPQHRILLELAWEALERAGIDPHSLFDSQAGVFLGLSNSDYSRLLIEHAEMVDGYAGIGGAISIAAGRLAYFFGTHGPAMAVDTACSSSLVAIHQAVQSLRRGETGLALVGGANLILSPETTLGFSRSGMLSAEGRCKVFSASADGYVRSEGCCVMVLKRLADAEQSGDKVLAVIHGTAVNQDGRSAGITAPNGPAQSAVMRAALKDASLDPSAVTYVEAHGTGTPLGDPMELQALAAVYGPGRVDGDRLKVGSIKSNLGHTEAAAGLASLAKVVLMMQSGHGFVPNLHLGERNHRLDWNTLPIEIVTEAAPWNRHNGTVYAGVSSFGFSGTNAHLIVGAAPQVTATSRTALEEPAVAEGILFFSATHPESLQRLAHEYIDLLERSAASFHDVCQNSLACRARLAKRIAVRASSAAEGSEKLRSWLEGNLRPGVMTNLVETTSADTSHPSEAGPLGQHQWELVFGNAPTFARPRRRVDLPLQPFRRTSYWFGPAPELRRQQQRERAWQVMNQEASHQSLRGPLGWNIHGYTARWKTLEKLTRLHAQHVLTANNAFPQTGRWETVPAVIGQCGFRPVYANLLTRWLNSLAEDGTVERSGEQYRATGEFVAPSLDPAWRETAQEMADDPAAFHYLERCGALLGDVLTGRKPALETLFPDGSFEPARQLYEQSVEARYFNPIVASPVRAAVEEMRGSRPLRLLEIGAGTGGTTTAVLEYLGAADPGARLEYWFTDVSEIFISRAKKQFARYAGVHYALFDLERDPEEQGFPLCAFDLVIAANAVHAVRNLDTALHTIQRLLAPGAALVLLETTRHHAWFDMSTGLIEGWQRFEDAYRQDQPLLDPGQWQAALTSNGFVDVTAYPGSDSPAAELGQHVILARTAPYGSAETFASGIQAAAKGVRAEPRLVDNAPLQTSPEEIASPADFALRVRQTICSVFQLPTPPEELGDRDRLSDLGMDSLIALELRAELSRRLELPVEIPSTIAFETGTVGELVRALEALRGAAHPAALPPSVTAPSTAPRITATQLESMTDEQVEQLLEERLGRS